eukprot:TRINITY_DN5053_c1_g1_i1.p1 TRINITY_DN5053_c1_g1~~TRINITY_DN5053_c1_g1_i1.p1  ORF type:complete len:475 (+),score=45.65 TRINITY_DN5053_c1_g1_i1:66-1427(+)
MGQTFSALNSLVVYYKCMGLMIWKDGRHEYDSLRKITGGPRVPFWNKYDKSGPAMDETEKNNLFAAVVMHSIGLMFKLWNESHYRAENLQEDLVNNFKNIAVPGTGVPLSLLCCSSIVMKSYFLFAHPLVTFIAALQIRRSESHAKNRSVLKIFSDELLHPGHWFSLWRINSILVAAHYNAHSTRPAIQTQYNYENKWDFLEMGLKKKQFKVTPIMDVPEIVCKHKNIEGGMGIHIFKNAVNGGDWIIQERLRNAKELQEILPQGAPLSTFRVITMSDPTAENFDNRHVALTTVFRAGRDGKATDHSSILMPVDETGHLQEGKAFSNWYQVGVAGSHPLSKTGITHHSDTGIKLTGHRLKASHSAKQMCIEAHRRMMPSVPAVGWDVAITDEHGPLLLEANLSCNLFGGTYNEAKYLQIVDTYFANKCRGSPNNDSDDDGEYSSTAGLTSLSS